MRRRLVLDPTIIGLRPDTGKPHRDSDHGGDGRDPSQRTHRRQLALESGHDLVILVGLRPVGEITVAFVRGRLTKRIGALRGLTSLGVVSNAWWELPGWPRADEWQAFWAFVTFLVAGVAVALALLQLRQTANAQLEQSRPIVVVDSHFRSTLVSIEVKNVGLTSARDVKLAWSDDPALTLPAGARTGRPALFRKRLVEVPTPFLATGRTFRYTIGRGSEYPSTAPRSFTVRATYKGPDGKTSWSSESILDLDQWAESDAEADYENKNWNEQVRHTKAHQQTATAMKSVSESLESLSDFVELHPSMQKLRGEEREQWRTSFGGTGHLPAGLEPPEESPGTGASHSPT